MGDRVRAAQAAAAEEKKNNAAYTTSAQLPSFNANMQPQQNSWTYDAQGNPQFVVPGFIQARQSAPPTGSLADYIAGMTAKDPNTSNPAYDAVHSEFSDKGSTLQRLLGMLVNGSGKGKPMSPDNTAAMRQNNAWHLARINSLAPGKYPAGNSGGLDPAAQGPTNLHPYWPFGSGRMY